MNDKKFTWIVLIIFSIMTFGVVGFNFWIDPMWHFAHSHEFNDVQITINEREQKTAELLFQNEEYDTILLGSSRSTYISPKSFEDWNVYNFSASNLSIREYESMIQFADNISKQPVERYIFGVDFFKSSEKEASSSSSLTEFEKKVEAPFYRAKTLLSLDLLDYSIKNFEFSRDNNIVEGRFYNRENTAFAKKLTEHEINDRTAKEIIKFNELFYGTNYEYFDRYKKIMQDVKNISPTTEKIVFTTPISTELFKALVETDLLDDYENWLRDLVDVFGGVWNFMYPNSITNDISNYYDGHHFNPEVGNLIALRLKDKNAESVPEDFGVYVTKENIEQHLSKVQVLADSIE